MNNLHDFLYSMKNIGKNIGIFLWAMVAALAIFYIVKNPDFFTASILSLQEITTIKEQWWDIAYKTDSWAIDIFVADQVTDVDTINFTINFNNETVTIDPEHMTGQSWISILGQDETSITLSISDIDWLKKNESAIILPFQWTTKDILISESKTTLHNGQQKDLSVGILNQNQTHSQ